MPVSTKFKCTQHFKASIHVSLHVSTVQLVLEACETTYGMKLSEINSPITEPSFASVTFHYHSRAGFHQNSHTLKSCEHFKKHCLKIVLKNWFSFHAETVAMAMERVEMEFHLFLDHLSVQFWWKYNSPN